MELIRRVVPYDASHALKLIREIFGEEEALLESPQLTGAEVEENTDIVYEAWEDGVLAGTIHATIPKMQPAICGLSAMCTATSHRGKGVGKLLFAKILEEIDGLGVQTAFLGTGNPIAAKLYHDFGFAYMMGSGVMERYVIGNNARFRQNYTERPESYQIIPGSAAMRIPMIPLIVCGGRQRVLDINTSLYNCSMVSQLSCMSLYPRYEQLVKDGGKFWGVVSNTGVLGAVLSAKPTKQGIRADFYCGQGFEDTISELMAVCLKAFPDAYMQVADMDIRKQPLVAGMGWVPGEKTMEQCGSFFLPVTKYYHNKG